MKIIIIRILWLFCLLSMNSHAQSHTFDYEVTIEIRMYADKFYGIQLTDSGLFAGGFYKKKRLFLKDKFKYKSIYIQMEEIDENKLLLLHNFLEKNQGLESVKAFYANQFFAPNIYTISNRSNSKQHIIFDDGFRGSVKGREYDRYLINKLIILMNDLIPDEYSDLRIRIFYTPNPSDIIRDRDSTQTTTKP